MVRRIMMATVGLLALAFAGSAWAVPDVVAATCTPTGYVRDSINLTAAVIDPATPVTGEVDATGCNIGVYFGPGSGGTVDGAEVHGANYFGVVANGAAVDVRNSDIHDIGETPFNGAQHGVGIYYRAAATGTVEGNTVSQYQKGGIVASDAGTVVEVRGNTVTGLMPVPFIAQNGIQIGYGASGAVKDNAVDGNSYSGSGWTSTGVLVFETNGVQVQGNVVANNQSGIVIEAWCWIAPSADGNKVVNNTVSGAQWGITVAAYAIGGYSTCDASASDNKITNNTISGPGGDTGIFVGTGVFGSTFVPIAATNSLTANTVSGFATSIDDSGTGTSSHANVVSP